MWTSLFNQITAILETAYSIYTSVFNQTTPAPSALPPTHTALSPRHAPQLVLRLGQPPLVLEVLVQRALEEGEAVGHGEAQLGVGGGVLQCVRVVEHNAGGVGGRGGGGVGGSSGGGGGSAKGEGWRGGGMGVR